jgi:SAM-dependent methyltransferase
MTAIQDSDAYGKGLLAYLEGNRHAAFTVSSDVAETERWPVKTFFRSFADMPEAERVALSLCEGRVLDAGAGAGSHALWLASKGHDVTAIDVSPGAVEVMQRRGLTDARLQDFFTLSGERYDTILMLMNGIGITGRIERLDRFFIQAKSLLNPEGRIVLDSSDIIYLFLDDDGSALIDLNAGYYGEVEYRMDYGRTKGAPFDWLFIDFDTLADAASRHGFSCTKRYEDDHYLYVAELRLA